VSRLSQRVQLLLDEERHQRLRSRAVARGMSVGAVIREAIDVALEGDEERRRAGESFLSAARMSVGEWSDIEREIDDLYRRDVPGA